MTELCDIAAVELRRMIGAKEISPVELLQSCLERIERVNPALNAITATCIERAKAEAKAAEKAALAGDALGPLHGLPIGIKDLNETEGLRTTWGSPLYADYVPAKDERMVAAVRRAGAIIVGKTNTPEFGAGANTNNPVYGPTGNPFDPKRICGGSSGGSAVALATSMLPLCTGSDTGGSLRIPAAFCGIVGFRPSVGLVASERRLIGWTPITTQGPMGRNVADTLLLLQAQVSADSRDPLAAPVDPAAFRAVAPVDLGSLRVAVSDDLGFIPLDPRIRATFRERIERIRPVFKSCEWRHPEMADADEAFAILRAMSFLAAHKERYEKHRDKLGPNIIANVEQGLSMSLADAARGQAQATRIYRDFQEFFREFDLLVTPTVPVPPFPLEQRYMAEIDGRKLPTYFSWLAPTYALSLTGHPSLSLPCGLEPTGTPFALQLCGPARGDKFLLDAAHALEQHLARDPQTARPLPDLAKLAR
ncbi:MAG TPA: amidase family protein [Stellaceae bacterium]|nr:amidase family protein [Stellaceae bacterium]